MKKASLSLMLLVSLCLGACGDSDDGDAPRVSVPVFYPGSTPVPTTGQDVPGIEPFDQAMSALLKKWNVPGAALAITKDSRLILARGYGYADFEAKQLMQPDSMFRVASNSKVLTGAAILHLKDQDRINLDEKFLNILTQYSLPPGADARLREVTVRHLLQHSGGWDRNVSGDPPFMQSKIALAMRIPTPVLCPDILRYMMDQPLDFAPGTRYEYSNVGYCALGLIVEKISGEPYEIYVRNNVLAPMNVHAMSIGYPLLDRRGPYEVKYYEYDGARFWDNLFSGDRHVPGPYGGYDPLTHWSGGGWVGSAIDLTRIMTAIDGRRGTRFLSDATMTEYTTNPNLPGFADQRYWYGLGIQVGPTPDTWSHAGKLAGTRSLSAHRPDGYDWALITNSFSKDGIDGADLVGDMVAAISPLLNNGLEGSAGDLYTQYPSPPLPPRYP